MGSQIPWPNVCWHEGRSAFGPALGDAVGSAAITLSIRHMDGAVDEARDRSAPRSISCARPHRGARFAGTRTAALLGNELVSADAEPCAPRISARTGASALRQLRLLRAGPSARPGLRLEYRARPCGGGRQAAVPAVSHGGRFDLGTARPSATVAPGQKRLAALRGVQRKAPALLPLGWAT